MSKICSKCKEKKEVFYFHKNKNSLDGHHSWCKKCKILNMKIDPIKRRINSNNWARRNKNKIKQYRKENPIIIKRAHRKYRNSHKFRRSLDAAKRRAVKLNQSPYWLTEDHVSMMKEIYMRRDKMNKKAGYIKYHVDHIIPLQGKECRGLHVPWNLQILEATENLSKSNKIKEGL